MNLRSYFSIALLKNVIILSLSASWNSEKHTNKPLSHYLSSPLSDRFESAKATKQRIIVETSRKSCGSGARCSTSSNGSEKPLTNGRTSLSDLLSQSERILRSKENKSKGKTKSPKCLDAVKNTFSKRGCTAIFCKKNDVAESQIAIHSKISDLITDREKMTNAVGDRRPSRSSPPYVPEDRKGKKEAVSLIPEKSNPSDPAGTSGKNRRHLPPSLIDIITNAKPSPLIINDAEKMSQNDTAVLTIVGKNNKKSEEHFFENYSSKEHSSEFTFKPFEETFSEIVNTNKRDRSSANSEKARASPAQRDDKMSENSSKTQEAKVRNSETSNERHSKDPSISEAISGSSNDGRSKERKSNNALKRCPKKVQKEIKNVDSTSLSSDNGKSKELKKVAETKRSTDGDKIQIIEKYSEKSVSDSKSKELRKSGRLDRSSNDRKSKESKKGGGLNRPSNDGLSKELRKSGGLGRPSNDNRFKELRKSEGLNDGKPKELKKSGGLSRSLNEGSSMELKYNGRLGRSVSDNEIEDLKRSGVPGQSSEVGNSKDLKKNDCKAKGKDKSEFSNNQRLPEKRKCNNMKRTSDDSKLSSVKFEAFNFDTDAYTKLQSNASQSEIKETEITNYTSYSKSDDEQKIRDKNNQLNKNKSGEIKQTHIKNEKGDKSHAFQKRHLSDVSESNSGDFITLDFSQTEKWTHKNANH